MSGDRTVRSSTATWMGAAFLALVALMGLAIVVFLREQSGGESIRHTIAVEAQSWRILSLTQDAETGQRGLMLTDQDSYLAPYDAAVSGIGSAIDRLASLTDDNPGQLARIAVLRTLVGEKLIELGKAIQQRRADDPAAAIDSVTSGTGKAIMDRIRAVIGDMQREEAALLERRQASVARVAWLVWTVLATVIATLVALGGWAVREAARRASLSRFLPEELSSRLASGDDALRAGRRQAVAVAFVDIRGSTALAEGLDPARLSVFLSSFRRRVMRTARLHGGVVDKFIGDGALVVFGIPDPGPDDAARALNFATDLVAVIARWNEKRANETAVAIGIGVHYGEVFCGIIGEETRLEFTVLGDTVNVASRLEGATKTHGVAVLVSHAAWHAAGEPPEGWREVSRTPLSGRREAMPYLTPVEFRGSGRAAPTPAAEVIANAAEAGSRA